MTTNTNVLGKSNGGTIKWCCFLYALFVLICFYPYEFYSVYFRFIPDAVHVTAALFIVITTFFLLSSNVGANTDKSQQLIKMAFVQFVGFFLVGLAHGNIKPAMGTAIIMFLAILLILFIDRKIGMVYFFKRYNYWILLMAILGSLTWLLVSFWDVTPISVVPDRADSRTILNYGLTFTKSVIVSFGQMRYAGFFDEPGAIAYWGIFVIAMNRLFIKNNKLEIVLIVCLIFTFSFGFYVQLLAYLVFFYISKMNRGRGVVAFVLILISLIAFGIAKTNNTDYQIMYDMVYGRIDRAIDDREETGSVFAVNDRRELANDAKKAFEDNPLFGIGADSPRIAKVGNNIFEPLAIYGIVGSLFILSPFIMLLIWGVKRRDWDLLKIGVVIWIGFSHRPFHAELLHFFIIYSLIYMYYQSKSSKSKLLGYSKP